MTISKVVETNWYSEKNLITTTISGQLTWHDIEYWELTLHAALKRVETGSTFKMLINLHGFIAADFETHKCFRTIIPVALAAYGWKVGYVDLFKEDARSLTLTETRGVRCIAAAHVHHDPMKMELYQIAYSKSNEHFFTDPEEAMRWLASI